MKIITVMTMGGTMRSNKLDLMSVNDFDGWLETLEIVNDKKAVEEIQNARKELDRGEGVPFEKISERAKL